MSVIEGAWALCCFHRLVNTSDSFTERRQTVWRKVRTVSFIPRRAVSPREAQDSGTLREGAGEGGSKDQYVL